MVLLLNAQLGALHVCVLRMLTGWSKPCCDQCEAGLHPTPACGADDDSASDDDEKGGRNPSGSAPPSPLPSPTKRSGTPWFELPPLPEMDISDAEKMELVSHSYSHAA